MDNFYFIVWCRKDLWTLENVSHAFKIFYTIYVIFGTNIWMEIGRLKSYSETSLIFNFS